MDNNSAQEALGIFQPIQEEGIDEDQYRSNAQLILNNMDNASGSYNQNFTNQEATLNYTD